MRRIKIKLLEKKQASEKQTLNEIKVADVLDPINVLNDKFLDKIVVLNGHSKEKFRPLLEKNRWALSKLLDLIKKQNLSYSDSYDGLEIWFYLKLFLITASNKENGIAGLSSEDTDEALTAMDFADPRKIKFKSNQDMIEFEMLQRVLKMVENFKFVIRDIIPKDIEDNQKGVSANWIKNQILSSNTVADELGAGHESSTNRLQYSYANRMHLRSDLESFFQMNRFISQQKRDLNRVSSAKELKELISAAEPAYEAYLEKRQNADAKEGTEFLGEDDTFKVYIAHNKGAACELGKGTQWCTAAPGLDYFNQYYKENDPLFVFINKEDPKEKYQFSYGSQQFMDKADERVDDSVFLQLDELLRFLIAKEDSAEKYPTVFKDREEDGFPARNRNAYNNPYDF